MKRQGMGVARGLGDDGVGRLWHTSDLQNARQDAQL